MVGDATLVHDPLAEMRGIVMRTLWLLFAGFAFAVLVYLVLFLLTSIGESGRGLAGAATGPLYWSQWQLVFLVAGIVTLYASYRMRMILLDPARLSRKVTNARRVAASTSAEAPPTGATARDAAAAASGAVAGAAQELVGRIVLGHVLIWGLLEVPALLGIVDRIVSHSSRHFIALITMSAIGMALHRPNAGRVDGILRGCFGR
jgi:hypothetical protein